MWIRSQNKQYLLKITGVYLGPDKKNLYALPEPQDYLIGTYSTEEAALLELDAIERWVELGGMGVYQIAKED